MVKQQSQQPCMLQPLNKHRQPTSTMYVHTTPLPPISPTHITHPPTHLPTHTYQVYLWVQVVVVSLDLQTPTPCVQYGCWTAHVWHLQVLFVVLEAWEQIVCNPPWGGVMPP